MLERLKAIHAFDRAATVMSTKDIFLITNPHKKSQVTLNPEIGVATMSDTIYLC
jgi:hypothetical protein